MAWVEIMAAFVLRKGPPSRQRDTVAGKGRYLFLVGQRDRLHHLTDRGRDGIAHFRDRLLEFMVRERTELPGFVREILVDARFGERRSVTRVFRQPESFALTLFSRRQSDRFLLRATHLVEPARGFHSDFYGVGFKIVVVGLPRVGPHRDAYVANILDLVDRARLGECTASGVVVAGQRGQIGQ
jgi:hypothetical protein